MILGDHARQPSEQVATDRRHHSGRTVGFRLFVVQPHDLRGDVGGIRVEAGRSEHPVRTYLVRQSLGLEGGPPVEPDDAVADWAT